MKSKHLRTQADVLAAYAAERHKECGQSVSGRKAMADWFGISQQAVCNWGDVVPTGYQYRVHLWATSKGYVLHPSAFGLRQDGAPSAAVPKAKAA